MAIQFKRGKAASFLAATDLILAEGQPGYETDTNKLKVGDGKTSWADLPYVNSEEYQRKIIYGTEIPSNNDGRDGDIYIQIIEE